jgi:diadenosine tetraphosphate (Ap4A) HIT family hydrolase
MPNNLPEFTLDPQLQTDCHVLGMLDDHYLLLLDNALLPWFILVPQTSASELFELDAAQQTKLLSSITTLSQFIKTTSPVEKLNVASIGNKVKQLHIHVIGRDPSDFCWPDVVWGRPETEAYSSDAVAKIVVKLNTALADRFTTLSL